MFATVQEVRLVGGESWHAPVLAAGATLLVAAAAAITAQFRLKAQLRHDRDLKFREHTRAVIDRVVTEAEQALRTLTTLEFHIRELGEDQDKRNKCRGEGDEDGLKRAAEAVAKDVEEVLRVLPLALRRNERLESAAISLSLRLGYDAPLVRAFKRHNEACKERQEYLSPFSSKGLNDADQETLKTHEATQSARYAAVLAEGDAWFDEERPQAVRRPWWKSGSRPDRRS